jgi:hypothetical protein
MHQPGTIERHRIAKRVMRFALNNQNTARVVSET